jgi:hypothetical protein
MWELGLWKEEEDERFGKGMGNDELLLAGHRIDGRFPVLFSLPIYGQNGVEFNRRWFISFFEYFLESSSFPTQISEMFILLHILLTLLYLASKQSATAEGV